MEIVRNCLLLLIAFVVVTGCASTSSPEYYFENREIQQPSSGVPFEPGDFVKLLTSEGETIPTKIIRIDQKSKTVFGWKVPSGEPPRVARVTESADVIVKFDEITGVQVAQFEPDTASKSRLRAEIDNLKFDDIFRLLVILLAFNPAIFFNSAFNILLGKRQLSDNCIE